MSGSCGWIAQSLCSVSQSVCEAVSLRLPENRCKWPLRVFVVMTYAARGCSLIPQRPTRALMGLAVVVELCWARRTSQGSSEGIVQSLCNTYETLYEFVDTQLPESQYGWPVRATLLAVFVANYWFSPSITAAFGIGVSSLMLENFWSDAQYRSAVADRKALYHKLQALEQRFQDSSKTFETLDKEFQKVQEDLAAIRQCQDLRNAIVGLIEPFETFVGQASNASTEEGDTFLQTYGPRLTSYRTDFQALEKTCVGTTALYQDVGGWLQQLETAFSGMQSLLELQALLTLFDDTDCQRG